MAGQEPCLALVEQVGQHEIEVHQREVVVVAGVRHLHILRLRASHRSALVPQVVGEELGLEQRMAGHMLATGSGDRDQSVGDCQGDHKFHLLVPGHREQPAYRLGQHLRGHHFEKRRLKRRGHRIVPTAARTECCRRSILQCEQHRQHQGQQANAQRTAEDTHQMRLNEH